MTRDEIFAKVVEIVKPYVKNEDALTGIADDTNILEDLKVNSARLVDIILNFEDPLQSGQIVDHWSATGILL